MPNLAQSLQGQDLGHLHIIAELWGIDLSAPDFRQGVKNLTKILIDSELVSEVVESLPQETQDALAELQSNTNRIPWGPFTRKYGDLRPMGPAKRDRENPHRAPTSITETLWYRAIIGRAFFETDDGPQEFAYIPKNLTEVFPSLTPAQSPILSRPATPAERKHALTANDNILDDATTFLAALRIGLDIDNNIDYVQIPTSTLMALLRAAKLIDKKNQPDVENTRAFLESTRGDALLKLFLAWQDSPDFNDLHHIPHLESKGPWQNNPLKTRRAVLGFLSELDPNTWWSLPALLTSVQTHQPDFQRTGGEYDSWYIKDIRTGDYVRGEENWTAVEGELLKFFLTGPLHWLGLIDLGMPDKTSPAVAFRFSALNQTLLAGNAPALAKESKSIQTDSKLIIQVPPLAPRSVRYQIARFCNWEAKKKGNFTYRITPTSLEIAKSQGLKITHLTTLLTKNNAGPLPPNLSKSLERWDKEGTQAHLETMLVLRVNSPEILQALRDSRAKRFLGDPLGPTTIMVKPGAWQQVMEALGEVGYLVQNEQNN